MPFLWQRKTFLCPSQTWEIHHIVRAHRLPSEGSRPSLPGSSHTAQVRHLLRTLRFEIPAGAPWSALWGVEGQPRPGSGGSNCRGVGALSRAHSQGGAGGPAAGPEAEGLVCPPSSSAGPPQACFRAGLPPACFSVPHGDSQAINYPFPLKMARGGLCCNSES